MTDPAPDAGIILNASSPRASLWSATAETTPFESLARDEEADVCVIGAGIAGLTTAYQLLEAGRSVVVLEDGLLGGGMTCRTSAHLSAVLDDRFHELERLRGPAAARLAAASHAAAIDRIEEIVTRENIRCHFRRVAGYLFPGSEQAPEVSAAEIDKEHAAAERAGIAVEKLSRTPVAGFGSGPCLRFPGQAQFHPVLYIEGLAHAVIARGGRIRKAHAVSLEGRDPVRILAGGHTVRAHHVVVATNVPVNNMLALHLKLAAYMTYVIAVRIPRGAVPESLYWDTDSPYHYIRVAKELAEAPADGTPASGAPFDVLIVGGEDHRTGEAPEEGSPHDRLEAWVRARIPAAGEVIGRWGGQVMETVDGLAYIGRNPVDHDHVYVVTGDSGMGLTHGTVAGMLLADLITGQDNPWKDLYDPSRVPLKASAEFAPETLHAMARYADWFTGSDIREVEALERGQGAVVRDGLTKAALYRDEGGVLHACSAVCPHLGCVVAWNGHEKTWDCPCHGSRFDPLGRVLNGPANRNLTPYADTSALTGGDPGTISRR
jgi:glycine/D-amino acid oxidase-like deaminating enzyme/nitrite reductase/ring-hydroxylating ferredoxin subunit